MRILVHLHVYYHDQIDWFLNKFTCFNGRDWDLVVSYSEDNPLTRSKVLAFKNDARFMQVENVGYDIWPFLKLLDETDYTGYDVLFKFHTKHIDGKKTVHLNHVHYTGAKWRDELVNSLIGSEERLDDVLRLFESHPEAGMACSGKLYTRLYFPEDKELLDEEMKRLNLHTEERRFCAGTMMAFRPAVLKVLADEHFTPSYFAGAVKTDSGGSMSHVYERILNLLAPSQGYTVLTFGEDEAYRRMLWRKEHIQKALNWIFSIDHLDPSQEKYLTVFGLKFKLSH